MTADEARQLKELIDGMVDEQGTVTFTPPAEERAKPIGKRVVRTKSQGDKVFYLDDVEKTRSWIVGSNDNPGPELVDKLGFSMEDVEEISDMDLMGYKMVAPTLKVDEPA